VKYSVKEIFYTLQGEGLRAGRPAVFCRFAGCNLWSGREADRESAVCRFCDTDFVLKGDEPDGGKFASATTLAQRIGKLWPEGESHRYVVLTGGEPLLQVDSVLLDALHAEGFEIAVETNGTLSAPNDIDWICVSPKFGAPLVQTHGHELKLVWPQHGMDPSALEELEFANFLLQPMDGPFRAENTRAAIDYCKLNPKWRLSIQTHKVLEIR
jgi:7-carboxy-7-deazaguanine synthase (Cx14CxxC type)